MEKILTVVFSLVLGIGGILVAIVQLRNLARLRFWKTARGKIIERGTFRVTHSVRSPPAFQHSPLVKYVYRVEGQEFVNDSILPKHIQLPEHNTIKWAEKRAASFPDEVTVYYNPENPGDAFLERTSKIKLYAVMGGGLLALLAGALFLMTGS
jgi:hypothetical protein